MTTLHSTGDVAKRTGLSNRQLMYWELHKAVFPASPPRGTGSRSGWSDDDLARLQVVAGIGVLYMRPRTGGLSTDLIRAIWMALNGPRSEWPEVLYCWFSDRWRSGRQPGLTAAAFLCVDVVFVLRSAEVAA